MTPDLYRLANESRDKLAEITWGWDALMARFDEQAWDGNRSPTLDGSGGGSDVSRPTEAAVIDDSVGPDEHQAVAASVETNNRRRDPAAGARQRFVGELRRVHAMIDRLHVTYAATVVPQLAPGRMENPGCVQCMKIPEIKPDPRTHKLAETGAYLVVVPFPRVHCHIKIERVAKGATTIDTMGVCAWCYGFWRSVGRLPTVEECRAHAEGRPVRRSA